MRKRYYDFEHSIENIKELIKWLDQQTDGKIIIKSIGGGPNHTYINYQITDTKKVFIIYETMEEPYTYYAHFEKFAKSISIKDNKEVIIDGKNHTQKNTYTDIELKTII